MNLLLESTYNEVMDNTVMPQLEQACKQGDMQSFDGAPIHWYSYTAKDPVKTVVILHGFTESARKFSEMIWYFLSTGYNVYIYDQRGHGKSHRTVAGNSLTHIDRFEDYVKDLELFIDHIVPHDLPLFLYAHSMGGAVSALYLEKHGDVFKKAVLSSPMIAPDRGGYPLFISKLICRIFIMLGKGKEMMFLSSEYPGEEKFEDSCGTSFARFDYYNKIRCVTPHYQNYCPTYRWTLESLNVAKKILKKGAPERVSSQVLVCVADNDNVVINSYEYALASRLPKGSAKGYDAKHEIYNSADPVMQEYVTDILTFFAE